LLTGLRSPPDQVSGQDRHIELSLLGGAAEESECLVGAASQPSHHNPLGLLNYRLGLQSIVQAPQDRLMRLDPRGLPCSLLLHQRLDAGPCYFQPHEVGFDPRPDRFDLRMQASWIGLGIHSHTLCLK
jgi:hypothetical protein